MIVSAPQPSPEVNPSAGEPDRTSTLSNPSLFIMGASRSGTTLVTRLLDAHTSLAILPETWMFVELDRLRCFGGFVGECHYQVFMNRLWHRLKSIDEIAARVVASQAMREPVYVGPVKPVLEKMASGYMEARNANTWGEKTPGHALWLTEIRDLFPDCRMIFCIRDPRDVLISYCERWNQNRFDETFVMKAAAMVRHYLHHMLKHIGFSPEQIHWVRYEALVSKPIEVINDICTFLHVGFETEMTKFYERGATQKTNRFEQHHQLLSEPIRPDRVGRFERLFSPSTLGLVEDFLQEEMLALGYTLSAAKASYSASQLTAQKKGIRLYQRMRSGELRYRERQKASIELRVHELLNNFMQGNFRRLAVSSEDWGRRLSTSSR